MIETHSWLLVAALTASSLAAQTTTRRVESHAVHAPCASLLQANESEPNDSCALAIPTRACVEWTGAMSRFGDTDFYRLDVTDPSTVTLATHLDTSVTGIPLIDSRIWLYDATCRLIDGDDDSGPELTARLEVLLAPGTYYAEVSHHRRTFEGDYRFTIDRRHACVDAATSRAMRLAVQPQEPGASPGILKIDVDGLTPVAVMHVGFGAPGLLTAPIQLTALGYPLCLVAVAPKLALPIAARPGGESGALILDLGRMPIGWKLHFQGAGLRTDPASIVMSDHRLEWSLEVATTQPVPEKP